MPRRRLRTFTLWTGTLLCVLIAAAFVVSAFRLSALDVPGGMFVATFGGMLMIGADDLYSVIWHTEPRGPSLALWNVWELSPYINFPLYAVFLAAAVPTLLVWRFVPKFPRGHCRRCGYNLIAPGEAWERGMRCSS
jgi:hypothetical protein